MLIFKYFFVSTFYVSYIYVNNNIEIFLKFYKSKASFICYWITKVLSFKLTSEISKKNGKFSTENNEKLAELQEMYHFIFELSLMCCKYVCIHTMTFLQIEKYFFLVRLIDLS